MDMDADLDKDTNLDLDADKVRNYINRNWLWSSNAIREAYWVL